MKKPKFNTLCTPFEAASPLTWSVYPRPQLVRESYLPLDGTWELSVSSRGKLTPLGKIIMPYVPESRLSGVMRTLGDGEAWVYTKRFTLPDGFNVGRVLLHFGAVDQITRVSVNADVFPEHVGGYLPFEYDITDSLNDGENMLTVEVCDRLDTDIPYGKQSKKRGGMWYTPISGIWQTVWLESVPDNYISSLKLTPTLDSICIEAVGGNEKRPLLLRLPTARSRMNSAVSVVR